MYIYALYRPCGLKQLPVRIISINLWLFSQRCMKRVATKYHRMTCVEKDLKAHPAPTHIHIHALISFLAGLLSVSSPSLYLYLELPPATCKILHMALLNLSTFLRAHSSRVSKSLWMDPFVLVLKNRKIQLWDSVE